MILEIFGWRLTAGRIAPPEFKGLTREQVVLGLQPQEIEAVLRRHAKDSKLGQAATAMAKEGAGKIFFFTGGSVDVDEWYRAARPVFMAQEKVAAAQEIERLAMLAINEANRKKMGQIQLKVAR